MLILAKAILAFMIGFMLTIIAGLVFIPILKRKNIKQTINDFVKKHKSKAGTPTMGGLIFIIPTVLSIIILLLTNSLEFTYNLFLILFVFLSHGLLGFIDDYLIIKRGSNEGLTILQKLFGQVLIVSIFYFIYMKSGVEPILAFDTIGFEINLGWAYGIFILLMVVGSSNAVNITDGLDGLAGGLSAIAFLALGMMTWASAGLEGGADIGIFCFILVGSLIAFLFFNSHPAKIFMGDTGSLALGATLASVAIISKHELTFVAVAGVFIIETLASIIQIISIRLTKKKIFLMTPLHHHFEKLGWEETAIVKTFWVAGLLCATAAILFAVWI